ncbi:MAG: hypothetical protein RMI43_03290 [Candidatus Caldarchaeum sp.]|nr:hypothetical protein [Candidatus Caldarchaeum sp.]
MAVQAIAVVFILTVIQLAQGIALRLELVQSDFLVLGHIGLGVLTTLLIIAVLNNIRTQNIKVKSDLSFLLVLILLQGLAGLFIIAEIEIASLIHLVMSFFVVASAAASLIIAASGS